MCEDCEETHECGTEMLLPVCNSPRCGVCGYEGSSIYDDCTNLREVKALQEQGFTKKDWTLFRSKIVDWQEAYMDRLNKEYIELLSEDADSSEKFWKLDKRIKEDKKKAGVQLEMSRSNLIYNISSLIKEGAIGYEDLDEFSDELKETVRVFAERWFRK